MVTEDGAFVMDTSDSDSVAPIPLMKAVGLKEAAPLDTCSDYKFDCCGDGVTPKTSFADECEGHNTPSEDSTTAEAVDYRAMMHDGTAPDPADDPQRFVRAGASIHRKSAADEKAKQANLRGGTQDSLGAVHGEV